MKPPKEDAEWVEGQFAPFTGQSEDEYWDEIEAEGR